jgi:hypothetical protein
MKKTVKIHQFDPVIYPVKLWVVITDDLLPIADKFVKESGKEFNTEFKTKHHAFTENVVEKETYMWGIIVIFRSKKDMNVGLISHESTHVAREIWNRINESVTGIEADAYLVEWIANCIEKVKLNKE